MRNGVLECQIVARNESPHWSLPHVLEIIHNHAESFFYIYFQPFYDSIHKSLFTFFRPFQPIDCPKDTFGMVLSNSLFEQLFPFSCMRIVYYDVNGIWLRDNNPSFFQEMNAYHTAMWVVPGQPLLHRTNIMDFGMLPCLLYSSQ